MKAVTWQGIEQVSVDEVPDPRIIEPTDAVVRVTSTAICGSDLHLYKVLAPFLTPGDIIGHEFMGVVEEVGTAVAHISPGDRVVVPFTVACGRCWMCGRGLFAQCETTQVTEQGKGRYRLPLRRLRRRGGPHADAGHVRQGHHPAHGPVPRAPLDR